MALGWAFTAGAAGLDDDFLAARDAARVGDSKRLEQLLPKFKGHLLEPYVRYWRLQQRLAAREPAEIRAYLAQHRDTPLSDTLRRDWLKLLGENGQWELFDAELPGLVNEDPYGAGWMAKIQPAHWEVESKSLISGDEIAAAFEAKMNADGFGGC